MGLIPQPPDGEGAEELIETVEELGDLIIDTLDPPDWTDPTPIPFPSSPTDVIGAGDIAIDAIIDFIVKGGTGGTPCNRLFRRWIGGSACAQATCNKTFCRDFLQSGQHNAGPFNDCIDSIVEGNINAEKARPLIEEKLRALGGLFASNCRNAATNGPCCKDGRKKKPADCPAVFPPPDKKPRLPCQELQAKCQGPNPPVW